MTRALVITTAILTALSLPLAAEPGNPGAQFMYNWDLDEDGYVTLAEALDRREAIFAAFDYNEDGVLDDSEYEILDEARAHDQDRPGQKGQGRGAGRELARPNGIGAGFAMDRAEVDLNGDGTVTRSEFIGSVRGWFASRDMDDDGRLSAADFGRRG